MISLIKIKTRRQLPSEPYCGPITYCAVSNTDVSKVKYLHKKASIKPSLGFFYLSFHKLNKNIKSYIERKGSMLDKKDIKCFETMWQFEKASQKISKEDFINKVVKSNSALFKKYKSNVKIYSKMTHKDYSNLISASLKKQRPVGVMVLENLNKYSGKSGKFFIPHWVTVHGIKHGSYLVFNSYEKNSRWVSKSQLFSKIDLLRKYNFSPQIITLC